VVYEIQFADSANRQLKVLKASDRTLLVTRIEKQLCAEPLKATRNRKPLRPNPIAPWELRVKNLRVFYDVSGDERNLVNVLAIGIKQGNKIFIEGEEIEL
jgi:mRNA-degrading endonuclease RelE of RelBE toxin-antitoxin system